MRSCDVVIVNNIVRSRTITRFCNEQVRFFIIPFFMASMGGV